MKIRKTPAALLTAAAMAASLFAVGAGAEHETVENYGLRVMNVQVTSANADDIFSDGKVSFDPAKNVLTIKDDIEYTASYYDPAAFIYSSLDELTIKTEGDIELNFNCYGIGLCNNVTFETGGKLTINQALSNAYVFFNNMQGTDRFVSMTFKNSDIEINSTGSSIFGNNESNNATLTFINTRFTGQNGDGTGAISGFNGEWTFTCCEITEPEGWQYTSNHLRNSDGSYATGLTIAPGGHVEGEAVKENEVPADCENEGSYDEVVYCTVCGEELSRETMTIDALDHDWGEPTYEWAEDGSYCTARVVCNRDEGHVIGEKAVATSQVKTPATEDEKGTTTYTANFETELFETQTLDLQDIPTLEPEEESGEEGSEPESSEESSDPESSEPESEPEKPAPTPQDQGTNPATGAAAGLAVIAIASAAAVALKKRK